MYQAFSGPVTHHGDKNKCEDGGYAIHSSWSQTVKKPIFLLPDGGTIPDSHYGHVDIIP